MTNEDLIAAAIQARERAYAPYSHFPVGATLLTRAGTLITGCNVENISYGLTLCAERVALNTAIAAGHREFSALAVVADTQVPISPCGACRQALAEFAPHLTLLLANLKGTLEVWSLDQLLPRAKTGILDYP